jgi:predicted lipid-binding transport protein (Tim44 family)
MGDVVQFIDILILAMIAAFLVYRLRSVLGRRHGEERQRPNPYAQQPGPRSREMPDNVVKMPEPRRAEVQAVPPGEPMSLAAAIDTVRAADPTFDEKQFIHGARAAFEMIVTAFARGDTGTLRPLLSDDVYSNFARAIAERTARGEVLDTRIEALQDADIVEATLDGRTAMITVRFVSDQLNVTRAADGSVVDGDPDRALEVVDIWTFARDTRSRDPNWTLVETRVPS